MKFGKLWMLLLACLLVAGCGDPRRGGGGGGDSSSLDDNDPASGDDDVGDDDDDSADDDDDSSAGDDDDSADDDDDSSAGDDDDSTDGDDDSAPSSADCVIDFVSCSATTDCVEVAMDCCSCTMGGQNTAINASCLSQWSADIEATFGPCADLGCDAVYLCDGSIPRCEAGVCTYHP